MVAAVFSALSPLQRRLLLIGAGAVALLVVARRLFPGAAPTAPPEADPADSPDTGATTPGGTPTTDAIGVGQLTEFEDSQTQLYQALASRVDQLAGHVSGTNAHPPASPRTATKPQLWAFLARLYGHGTGPTPFSKSQIMAELYRRHASVNVHHGTPWGDDYALYALAHAHPGAHPESSPAVTPQPPPPPAAPEHQAQAPPAPAKKAPAKKAPAKAASSSAGSAPVRPAPAAPPVGATPDAALIAPAQLAAAVYGPTAHPSVHKVPAKKVPAKKVPAPRKAR